MRLSKKFSRRSRKVFFFIHLWTGLLLGLWFAVVGLTGSALAWMNELTAFEARTRLSMPKPSGGEPVVSVSGAVESVGKQHPELSRNDLSAMLLPNARFPFYIFWKLPKSRGADTWMYVVNPDTGQAYPPLNYTKFWIAFVKDLHMRLVLGATGLIANGVLSFFALFMLLSGVWLWWPSNLNQLKLRLTLKRSHSLKRTLYDLHNIMGIYLYSLLFLTTLTAVVWVYDDVTRGGVVKAMDGNAPARDPEPEVKAGRYRLPVDELVHNARSAVPDGTLYYLKLPVKPEQPLWALFARSSNGLLSEGQVWLDPYSGQTLKVKRSIEGSSGAKAMVLVEDLHKGLFLGAWSKWLYTLTGLMPLGLFITGFWMWLRKKLRRRPNPAAREK